MKALDLSKESPRSPKVVLGGYAIAARTLDKCRAEIAGTIDDYIYGCPLDQTFFNFTGISSEDFKEFVATGADDEVVAAWIEENAEEHTEEEMTAWNGRLLPDLD